jgi:hypothetical protein
MQYSAQVVVLDCLTCGLSLWDEQIGMLDALPEDWPR